MLFLMMWYNNTIEKEDFTLELGMLTFQLVRALCIVVIGYGLIRYKILGIANLTPLTGRLGRLPFGISYCILTAIMYAFYAFIHSALTTVIVLPSYWFLRTILFVGTVLAVPFYLTLFCRRLQDMAIPGWIAFAWVFFLVFAQSYGVVRSTSFFFNIIIVCVLLLVLFIPGTRGNNPYGCPRSATKAPQQKHPRTPRRYRQKKRY